ncbi:MAG: hypothetical protein R2911_13845 [Caldilineaceae bacterium]
MTELAAHNLAVFIGDIRIAKGAHQKRINTCHFGDRKDLTKIKLIMLMPNSVGIA